MLQETKNPLTGEWEMMTPRQWWLIKLGFPKDTVLDDCALAILKGPEHAVGFGFAVYAMERPGANAWLVKRYNDWFPRKPNAETFRQWCLFIEDVYDLVTTLKFIDDLHTLNRGIMSNSREAGDLKEKISTKIDNYYSRKNRNNRNRR